ncbi:MAG: serine hydrolase [Bacillus sp. (in: firmicutes)]
MLYIGIIIVVVIAVASFLALAGNRPDGEKVLAFIKENPEKASLSAIYNEEELAAYNSERPMATASVMKILIAIEYAEQAAKGVIKEDEMIGLPELERYYLENLDGGAHPEWLKSMEDNGVIKQDAVPLEEVAKGMIVFSSNANTEYLMDRLGLDAINRQIEKLGLMQHEPFVYFNASLLIPYELMHTYDQKLSKEEKIKAAKKELHVLSDKQYATLANKIHEKMASSRGGAYKREADIHDWYDEDFDRIFVSRSVKASTNDYATVLRKINSRSYFPENVQKHLEVLMETAMQSEGNQEAYRHVGMKGGSFASVLNMAIYIEDKQENTVEITIFLNGLEQKEFTKLSKHLNDFFVKVANDKDFRDEVKDLR